MPLSRLLCEGGPKGTDAVVLSELLSARGLSVRVEPWGDKQRLLASAGALLRVAIDARCICDRDFDESPEPGAEPIPLVRDANKTSVGWRWARHEIESYLAEPALATRALARTGWADAYDGLLQRAARSLIDYSAARWTIVWVAKQFPRLRHHREDAGEWHLVDAADCPTWLGEHLETHREAFPTAKQYRAHFDELKASLEAMPLADLLFWVSGKNLLAALAREGAAAGLTPLTPGDLRVELRDWVRGNPEAALELVPEWKRFVELVAAEA